MKKLLIISALILSPLATAQTESSFKYDFVGIGYSLAQYNDDYIGDFYAESFGVLLVKEIAPNFLLNLSASSLHSNYTYSNYDIDISGFGLNLSIGTYIPINKSADVVAMIGIGRNSFDTEITGYSANDEESDTTTSISFDLGARLYLDKNQRIELSPSIEISRSEGETSTGFDVDLGFKLSKSAQLVIGYGTSLDSDINVDIYSGSLYFYF